MILASDISLFDFRTYIFSDSLRFFSELRGLRV